MKKFILLTVISVFSFYLKAQQPTIQWIKNYGGTSHDAVFSVLQTLDGGYFFTGYTYSNDVQITFNNGYLDVWAVKTNPHGDIEWQRCLGGTSFERGRSACETSDGGFVVGGITYSNDVDVSGNHGQYDIWIVKLSASGNILWQKCLGGTQSEFCSKIQTTSDNGFIVCGQTFSNNGDVTGYKGNGDAWVVKLDSLGNIEWQKCLGGTDLDNANDIHQTNDNGYIVACKTSSNNGDVTVQIGLGDCWIVKLDSLGNIIWQKSLGGTLPDAAVAIAQTNDFGYIVLGETYSNDVNVSGNHGYMDIWVIKLDSIGNIQWQKCLGGSNIDGNDYDSTSLPSSILQTPDMGYILCSTTWSNNGDVYGNHGLSDIWIAKLDSAGNIQWQKCFGGTHYDFGHSLAHTSDGGFIIASHTTSINGDVPMNFGSTDILLIKFINYNISGLVFLDENQNGLYDPNEQGISGHLVKLEPGPLYTFTDNNGYYYFSKDIGSYTVSYIPPPLWNITSNSFYNFSITNSYQIIDTLDFGAAPANNINDVSLFITGSPTRASMETHYWLSYKNNGSVTASGTINFQFDPLLTFTSTTQTPYTINGNIISWNYGPIGPGFYHTIQADFQVPGIQYLGSTLYSNAWITPISPDTNIVNNYDTLYQIITGSYDPNDKLVSPAGNIENGYVVHGQKLTYTIRFQNTGTDTAFTVVIRDSLDLTNMNIETFNLEAFSHPLSLALKNSNELEFRFDNILLPDSNANEPMSHGFVKFSLSPKPGLPDYTEVTNTAYIYFDHNPPVITNTTLSTFVSLIPTTIESSHHFPAFNILIYPNPTIDQLNLSLDFEGHKYVYITNLLGQTIFQTSTDDKLLSIDMSELNKGMYFVNVQYGNNKKIQKIIKL